MKHDCVVIVLGPSLRVGLGAQWPLRCFELGGRQFLDTEAGDVTGFYDWLRDAQGGLVGVRFWPFEETMDLVQSLSSHHYVTTDASNLQVSFGKTVPVDESKSRNQAFQYSAIFTSQQGEHALVLGAEDLTPEDLGQLADVTQAERTSTCAGGPPR